MHTESVDVIIPVYRPDEKLKKLIKRLEAQSHPVHEIILINTEKKYFDDCFRGDDLLTRYDNIRVRHICKEQFDHGATRRLGVSLSKADYFICMTDDAVPADHFLVERLLEPLLEGKAQVSYARQLAGKDSDVIERCSRRFNYPKESRIKTKADLETMGIKAFFCSNVCAAYVRKTYDEQGGFEKHMIFNEDMVFAGRLLHAGGKIAYVAQARVLHSHHYTARQQFKRNFDLGVSQAQFPELFEGVSSSSEGIKLLRVISAHLLKKKEAEKIPAVFWNCGCRYLGYRFGKGYRKLPQKLIRLFTMNEGYWDRDKREAACGGR
ncbi:MAG: glycosyltransferase [Lachnospiraceae bacterium]|nr:glycosyltransferase [Lachnospiraceae bacterium]